MSTRPIVPSVLGPESERLLYRDVRHLSRLLKGLDTSGWERQVAGVDVRQVVAHLADGADELAGEIESRSAAPSSRPLHAPFHDAAPAAYARSDPGDPEAVLRRYDEAMRRLLHALGTTPQRDWSWPVWSPLGGAETLASAARRTLAHHYVHRHDVLAATGSGDDPHDATVRLVVEFVLDALARRGGELIAPPVTFEVVTSLPGAGTWQLVFDEPPPAREVDSLWDELVRHHPEARDLHRVERGSGDVSRAQIYATGEELWRTAFGRGGSWQDLEVHGDDEGRSAWSELTAAVQDDTDVARTLGRIQA